MYQSNYWGIWMPQLTLPHSYENPATDQKALYMPLFCVFFCDCHPYYICITSSWWPTMGKSLLYLCILNFEFSNPLKTIQKEAGISLFSIQSVSALSLKTFIVQNVAFCISRDCVLTRQTSGKKLYLLYLLLSHSIHNLER